MKRRILKSSIISEFKSLYADIHNDGHWLNSTCVPTLDGKYRFTVGSILAPEEWKRYTFHTIDEMAQSLTAYARTPKQKKKAKTWKTVAMGYAGIRNR